MTRMLTLVLFQHGSRTAVVETPQENRPVISTPIRDNDVEQSAQCSTTREHSSQSESCATSLHEKERVCFYLCACVLEMGRSMKSEAHPQRNKEKRPEYPITWHIPSRRGPPYPLPTRRAHETLHTQSGSQGDTEPPMRPTVHT